MIGDLDLKGLGTIIGVIFGAGGIGTYINNRRPKGSRENQVIDQIQEERAAERAEWQQHRNEMDAKLERMEKRLNASRRRERVRDDYIMELRQHIADGKKPPPPQYPASLTAIPGENE